MYSFMSFNIAKRDLATVNTVQVNTYFVWITKLGVFICCLKFKIDRRIDYYCMFYVGNFGTNPYGLFFGKNDKI